MPRPIIFFKCQGFQYLSSSEDIVCLQVPSPNNFYYLHLFKIFNNLNIGVFLFFIHPVSEYYVGRYTVCQGCIFSILTMGNIIFIAFGKNMVKIEKKVGEREGKRGKEEKVIFPPKRQVFSIFLPPGRVGWIRVKNEEVQLGKNMIFQRGWAEIGKFWKIYTPP